MHAGAAKAPSSPFRVSMGINTGFCNVGNFGSDDRMDYTIIGAEANLAARLQSIAEPGQIVLSYETYALVRDMLSGHASAGDPDEGHRPSGRALRGRWRAQRDGVSAKLFSEHMPGLDLYLDPSSLSEEEAARTKKILQQGNRQPL